MSEFTLGMLAGAAIVSGLGVIAWNVFQCHGARGKEKSNG